MRASVAYRTTAFVLLMTVLSFSGCGPRVVQPGPMRQTPFNPAASVPMTPNGGAAALDRIPDVPAESVLDLPKLSSPTVSHRVQPGDTLTAIGRTYGVTVEQLLQANGLKRSAILRPGQSITIPRRQ